MHTRREFLRSVAFGGAIAAAGTSPARAFFTDDDDPWLELPRILARIKPPAFPARDFDITKFGAKGDNRTDNTNAFAKAITVCNAEGGGRVVVPAGEFLTGAIHLRSNVNLHVGTGAVIRFTRDTKSYPLVLTRFEGMELMNFSPFIYAFEQKNIAITGSGTIDGNADADHWWNLRNLARTSKDAGAPKGDRDVLFDMAESGVAVERRVFGEGHNLRPNFIQPYRCQNVLIEGVTLLNSPMWQVHPVLSTNVTVRGLTIRAHGPNTDGCDPESCTDVLIKDCFFDTGDDCIAIKSGRNADGRRLHAPTQNVVIQGCHMKDGHGGVTLGSEITGGVRNVFAENCQMDSPHLDIAVRFKNNAMRGGVLENIHVRDITVGQVAQAAVAVDFLYEEGANGKFTPVLRNVSVSNLRVEKAKYALYLRGFEQAVIERITVRDSDFAAVENPNVMEHVRDVTLRNVRINGKAVEHAG